MQEARDFHAYKSHCPHPGGYVDMSESLTDVIAWQPTKTLARSRNAGIEHFDNKGRDAAELWEEFSSYIRQAHEYYVAARTIQGTSSALLYYYCALQLAKGELLASDADAIVGMPIHHGLSHRVSDAGNPTDDSVKVGSGVFPLLYRKRTGVEIPIGTQLKVSTLIEYVPEIGEELSTMSLGESRQVPFFNTVVTSASSISTLVALPEWRWSTNPDCNAMKLFSEAFERVPIRPDWKQIFSISPRVSLNAPMTFQSKRHFPNDGSVGYDELFGEIMKPLLPLVANPLRDEADAHIYPTMDEVIDLPMTPDLARYALMFYLSSLVRYKPAVLSAARYPDFAWLFESFTDQAGVNLVAAATDGITGRWYRYGVKRRA